MVQAAGLQPLMSLNMTVKYAGIANNPVKTAFKVGARAGLARLIAHTMCNIMV